ncbi:unnamed protein product [Parnassius mnemosyne]|uniref:Reverse transcriptase n=2 Tax=Parnassius mnemosyne TaxID=213953 RepID=A0AAV1LYH7_9NEOP
MGLLVNHTKSSVLSMVPDGKRKKHHYLTGKNFRIGRKWLPQTSCVERWRYLGIDFQASGCVTLEHNIKVALTNISKAPLKPQQRLEIVRGHLIPRFLHGLVLGNISDDRLCMLDVQIRGAVRTWLRLPKDVPVGYFHADIKDGGLAIPSLRATVPDLILKRFGRLDSSSWSVAKAAARSERIRKKLSWADKQFRKFTREDPVTGLRSVARFWRERLWSSVDGFELRESARTPASTKWIREESSHVSGRDFVQFVHTHINALPSRVRTSRGRRIGREAELNCRAGCVVRETTAHTIQQCWRTHGGRILRHDRVVKLVADAMASDQWSVVTEPHVKTSKGLRKPDIVAAKGGVGVIVDVQVVSGQRPLDDAHRSKVGMQESIDRVFEVASSMGLLVNHTKSSVLSMVPDGKRKKHHYLTGKNFRIGRKWLPQTSCVERWRYLGIDFQASGCVTLEHNIKVALTNISKAPLKPQQRLEIVRGHLIPRFLHGLVLGNISDDRLCMLDVQIRGAVRTWLRLPKDVPVGYFHADIKDGGLAIPSLRATVPDLILKRFGRLDSSSWSVAKAAARSERIRKKLSWADKQFRKFTREDPVTGLRSVARFWRERLWSSVDGFELRESARTPASTKWIREESSHVSGRDFVQFVHTHINALPSRVRTSRGRRIGREAELNCRAGCVVRETTAHTIQQCWRTHGGRILRHDRVVKLVADAMASDQWSVVTEPHVKTSKGLRKPDIVAAKGGVGVIVDVQVVSGQRPLDDAHRSKVGMQESIDRVFEVASSMGLLVNHTKSSVLSMVPDGKRKKHHYLTGKNFRIGRKWLPQTSCVERWRYLGIDFQASGCVTLEHNIKVALTNISKAPLKPQQRLEIVRGHLIPRFLHGLVLGNISDDRLCMLDVQIRGAVRTWLRLPKDVPVGYFHADIKDGGLAIPSLRATVPDLILKRFGRLDSSSWSVAKAAARSERIRKKLSWADKQFRKFTREDPVTGLRSVARFWRERLWSSVDGFELRESARTPASTKWIREESSHVSGRDFVQFVHTHINALPSRVRTSRGRRIGREAELNCRAGCVVRETTAHTIQQCWRTHGGRILRHDRVVKLVADAMASDQWSVVTEPHVKTSKGLRKPDIVAAKGGVGVIVDVQVVSGQRPLDDAHRSKVGMQESIDRVFEVASSMGLLVNHTKSSVLSMVPDGKRKKHHYLTGKNFRIGRKWLPQTSCVERWRYLGIDFQASGCVTLEHNIKVALTNISKAPLKPQQRLEIVRGHLIPRFLHGLVLGNISDDRLCMLDVQIRGAVRTWLRLPKDVPVGYFHADIKDGGLAIPSLRATVPDLILKRFGRLDSSSWSVAKAAARSERIRKKLSWADKQFRKFTREDPVTGLRSVARFWRERLWSSVDGFELRESARTPASTKWIREESSHVSGRDFVQFVHTHINALPSRVRTSRGRRIGREAELNCRAGCVVRETTAHTIQQCWRTHGGRILRHDRVVKLVADAMASDQWSVVTEPHVKTSKGLRKPDIVAAKGGVGVIVDVQVVSGQRPLDDAHRSKVGMQESIDRVFEVASSMGLLVNHTKSSVLSMVPDGKRKKHHYLTGKNFRIGRKWLPQTSCVERWRYLGIDFQASGCVTLEHNIKVALTNISKAPLKPQQRLEIVRGHLIPRFLHGLVLGNISDDRLCMLDVQIRGAVRTWLRLPKDVPVGYFHADIKDGGLAIPSLRATVPDLILKRFGRLDSSSWSVAKAAARSERIRKKLSWADKQFRKFTREDPVTGLRSVARFWRERLWSSVDGFELRESARTPASTKWIREESSHVSGRDFVQFVHTHINALPSRVRTSRGRRIGREAELNCRAGCVVRETTAHTIQQCWRTHGGRILRHDRVVKLVADAMASDQWSVVTEPHVKTSKGLRKPDIVAAKGGVGVIVDVQVVSGQRPLDDAHRSKVGMQESIDRVFEVASSMGLLVNHTKSSVLSMVPDGKRKKHHYLTGKNFRIGRKWLPQTSCVERWRYLGIDFQASGCVTLEHNIKVALTNISKAPLKPQQRLEIVRGHLIPRFLHGLVLGNISDDRLCMLDVQIRGAVRTWLRLPKDVPVGYFHADIKDGGLAIPSLRATVPDLILKRFGRLDSSSWSVAKAAARSERIRKKLSWADKQFRKFTREDPVTGLRSVARFWRERLWSSVDGFELRESARTPASTKWIREESSHVSGRDFVQFVHTHINALPSRVRTSRGRRIGREAELNCRAGCVVRETTAHTIQQCWRTHGGRILRHDRVVKLVADAMASDQWSVVTEPHVKTSKGLRKPDIVAAKGGVGVIVDVQVVSGQRPLDDAHRGEFDWGGTSVKE